MDLYELLVRVGNVMLVAAPCLIWCIFWLFAVNWRKTWAVLAQGAWAPLVLLIFMVTFVWSRIAWTTYPLQIVTIPNFWWQLGAVLLFVGLAFFCGWLQPILHLIPAEVEIEVAPVEHRHGHH